MAILLANIGTSDLAVQIQIDEKNYYLPIDYLQAEANISRKIALLPSELQPLWDYKKQRSYIETILYNELGFPANQKQTSRYLTKVLLEKYQNKPDYWYPRIKPVRILGSIEKAMSFGAKTGYIFVTNQQTKAKPDGEEKDTFYLFKILERWLQDAKLDFHVEPVLLDGNVNANELESMLKCYYKAINKISKAEKLNQVKDENELVLVSIKGGTEAMKTALQIQAIDAGFKKLVFLDPELSLERILYGQASECRLTLYWRHLQSQKYRTVGQLLDRWDFDGAIQVLADWQSTLTSLPKGIVDDSDISQSQDVIKSVIQLLEIGSCLFNLDTERAKIFITEGHWVKIENDINYSQYKWLNLYTLCHIHWQLNQVATFLPRLSSFVEELLNSLMLQLSEGKYFLENEDFKLDVNQLEPELFNAVVKLEGKKKIAEYTKNFTQPYWVRYIHNKLHFVEALVKFQAKDLEVSQDIVQSVSKLDYWIDIRNDLIHRATGVSKNGMVELCLKDCQVKQKKKKAIAACHPEAIVAEIANLIRCVSTLLNEPVNHCVDEDAPYYIYSEIRDSVLAKLNDNL